ncbi:MAG: type II toxin-antitoxin system RelE/ParE family toxin [bacterium]|nr:type II toxin-antitoxin system RelE/ParE family toxin [bacterium]
MANKNKVLILESVKKAIEELEPPLQARIKVAQEALASGDFQSVYTKSLQGPIRELIVRPYRLIFFLKERTIYFVGIFRKKTAKTPLQAIRNSLYIYKTIQKITKSSKKSSHENGSQKK